MKRIKHISPKVQVQVVEDYKAKNPDGTYKLTLKQIAEKHEISLSTVNNLARISKVQGRPKIGKKLIVPDARTMKLLRDATELNITLEEVGRLNKRWTTDPATGRRVLKPLTKQRVSQIINFWKKRGNPGLRTKGFKPGDVIKWADQLFTVVRYDSARKGAVRDAEGDVIDPFHWVHLGARSKLVTPAPAPPAEAVPSDASSNGEVSKA